MKKKNISIASIAFLILAVFFLLLPIAADISTWLCWLIAIVGFVGAYIFKS